MDVDDQAGGIDAVQARALHDRIATLERAIAETAAPTQQPSSSRDLDALSKHATRFSGRAIEWSTSAWAEDTLASVAAFAPTAHVQGLVKIVLGLLDGPAKSAMTGARPANLQELFAALGKLFTQHEYESRVRAAIANGTLIKDIGSQQIGQFLLRVFAGMSRTDFNAVELARVLSRLDDSIFVVLNISPDSVTVATFEELCQRFQERYDVRTALNQAKTAQRTSGQWRQRGSTPAAATSVPTTTSSSPPVTSQATPARTSQQRPKATSPRPNGQTA